jgi:3D (Asp-Asp-Asp) domain-containing protein
MIIATSMMTLVLYESGDTIVVKVDAASANIISKVDGPELEAITEDITIGVYYDSVIVSPDTYPKKDSVENLEVPTDLPIEIPTEPNREEIDISLLKTEEYLPDYKYGVRAVPTTVIPDILSNTDMRNYTDIADTSEYLYLGTYSITGYTPKCAHCCGNTKGITASGVEAIVGYTVAADSSIPFGTTLYIEGYGYYVVEDRGNFGKNVIDIAAPTHESCYDLTNYGVHVYVVPSTNNE